MEYIALGIACAALSVAVLGNLYLGYEKVVFRNLCHFSNMYKTGMTHEHRFRFRPSD